MRANVDNSNVDLALFAFNCYSNQQDMSSSDTEQEPSFASQADIDSFIKHLNKSKRILALCGAGLSAPSGIPTFMDKGNTWRGHKAASLSNIDAFVANPGLVWKYFADRRSLALNATPNKAHVALAKTAIKKKGFLCVTQNIDGLAQRAKFPRDRLYELHGSLFNIRCIGPTCDYTEKDNFKEPLCPALAMTEDEIAGVTSNFSALAVKPKDVVPTVDESKISRFEPKENPLSAWLELFPKITPEMREEVIPLAELPHCPKCDSLLRPDVVWFGEPISKEKYDAINAWIDEERKLDLMLVIGTRAEVYPAASFVTIAKEKGARVAWINLDAEHQGGHDVRSKDWVFAGNADEVLECLFEGVLING